MPDNKATIQQLTNTLPQHGKVEWIGLRPHKKADMVIVRQTLAIEGKGLEGDHYAGRSGNRSVTLVQAEHLGVIASLLHKQLVKPEQLRRNIMVSGINLLALKHKHFCIGEAVFEMTKDYLCEREQFGVKIGSFQALQHRCVDMFIEQSLAKSTMLLAALKAEDPDPTERMKAISTAKTQLSMSGQFVTRQGIQLHGGIGVTDEHDVGLYFKRMNVLNALFGDEQHHLRRFAELPSF